MTKIFLIAASALSIATPALAAEPRPASTEQTALTHADQRPARPRAEQRYCVVDAVTGSHIPYRVCQTRGEWMQQGFDPLERK